MTSVIILCLEAFGRIAKRRILRSISISKGVIVALRTHMQALGQSQSLMPCIDLVGQQWCRSKIKCDLFAHVNAEVSMQVA